MAPANAMLEAIPNNIFSKKFRLHQRDRLVGEVDTSVWREQGSIELEEGTYSLRREGFCSGDFYLERDGHIVARASKPSVLRNTFEIDLPNRHLTLRKLSPLNRRFGVFEGDKQIGSVYPLGIFTRRSNIDLPADWSLASRIFVFWLASLVWNRQNAAAS